MAVKRWVSPRQRVGVQPPEAAVILRLGLHNLPRRHHHLRAPRLLVPGQQLHLRRARPGRAPDHRPLGAAAGHGEDGDCDEAEGDPHPYEGPQDGGDGEGVQVHPALRVQGQGLASAAEAGLVPGAGPGLAPAEHREAVLRPGLQAPQPPGGLAGGEVVEEGVRLLRPPDLQHEAEVSSSILILAEDRSLARAGVAEVTVGGAGRGRGGRQLEHAGLGLAAHGVGGPAQEAAVVQGGPGDVVHRAGGAVHPRIIVTDITKL